MCLTSEVKVIINGVVTPVVNGVDVISFKKYVFFAHTHPPFMAGSDWAHDFNYTFCHRNFLLVIYGNKGGELMGLFSSLKSLFSADVSTDDVVATT